MGYAQNDSARENVQQMKNAGAVFQEVDLFSVSTLKKSQSGVPEEIKNYSLLTMDAVKMQSVKATPPETMTFSLPGKSAGALELVKVEILTDDFEAIEMPSGKVVSGVSDAIHYRGIVKGNPNSVAALSILDNEIMGVVSNDIDAGNLVLAKLDDSADHILYKDADIAYLNDFACSSDSSETKAYTDEQLNFELSDKAPAKCPRIFFDVGRDIVADKGGARAASNYITSLFNQVAVIYANENVSIKLSGIKAWTSNEPFTSNLGNYRKYRNNNGFNGDLAHLVNYKHSGGVAFVNGLCNTYNQGISGIGKNFRNVPTYSWSVYVISHELGHNFGSAHTHGCKWNGNNTQIDSCGGSQCGNAGIPNGGGTIMSYCHLKGTGINFNKGFGRQPGNVIRNTIARRNCVRTCNDGGGNCKSGDAVDVTFRNNSDCRVEYFWRSGTGLRSYGQLAAGQSRTQRTVIGHNWLVRRAGNNTKVDEFTINCGRSRYATSGSCNGGRGIVDGGVYVVRTKNNKCVTVGNRSVANGANVNQWDCRDQPNQKWRFNARGQGFYTIRNIRSGKCLDVSGASTSNRANIIQWTCNGTPNQQFRVTSIGNGRYSLTARHSNKCVDVEGGNPANGTNIIQWPCNRSNTNQHFTLRATSERLETTPIDEALVDQLLVFPNPAATEINLKIPESVFSEDGVIKIYSISGKLLIEETTFSDFTSINIQNLTSGNYFIKMTSNNQQLHSYFIKR